MNDSVEGTGCLTSHPLSARVVVGPIKATRSLRPLPPLMNRPRSARRQYSTSKRSTSLARDVHGVPHIRGGGRADGEPRSALFREGITFERKYTEWTPKKERFLATLRNGVTVSSAARGVGVSRSAIYTMPK